MSLLSWNCWGIAAAPTIRELRDICKSQQPSIVFLMETRAHRNRIENLRRSLKFANSFCEEANGMAGGLCLLWNNNIVIDVLAYSSNLIHTMVTVRPDTETFNCTFIYAPPIFQQRKMFWDQISAHQIDRDFP